MGSHEYLNSNNNNVLLGTVKPLSPDQEKLINQLVCLQEEFDQPSVEDLKNIPTSGLLESDSETKFKFITELMALTVKLTAQFSKKVPGFNSLLLEDQNTLFKAYSSEVMMLRGARHYDPHTDCIVFSDKMHYNREFYKSAGFGNMVDPTFQFGKTMATLKVDDVEYALITAIVIFTERPGLVESEKVEQTRKIYLDALQAYVMNNRSEDNRAELAKLLPVLTEVRTLSNLNSELFFSLKKKNINLPSFLAEIWDIQHGTTDEINDRSRHLF